MVVEQQGTPEQLDGIDSGASGAADDKIGIAKRTYSRRVERGGRPGRRVFEEDVPGIERRRRAKLSPRPGSSSTHCSGDRRSLFFIVIAASCRARATL